MSVRLQALARRRHALVARAAAERDALLTQGRALATPGRLAERAWMAIRGLKSRPVLLAGAAAALIALRPRGIARWAGRAWIMWRTLRVLRVWLRSTAHG